MVTGTRHRMTPSKLVTRFMLVVLLAGPAFLIVTRESNACSLPPPMSASEKLSVSSHVFAGKIVRAFPAPNGGMYEFKVDTVWKGPLHETSFFYRSVGVVSKGTSCERVIAPLSVGSQYLVFGNRYIGDSVGLRGSLSGMEAASRVIAEMGEGQRPVPGSSAPLSARLREAMATEERAVRIRFVVGIVVVVAGTATGGLVMQRRARLRRRNQQL